MKILTIKFADGSAQGQQLAVDHYIVDPAEGTVVVQESDGDKTTFNWANIIYVSEHTHDEDCVPTQQQNGQARGFFS